MDKDNVLSSLRAMMLADFEARQQQRVAEQRAERQRIARNAKRRTQYRQAKGLILA